MKTTGTTKMACQCFECVADREDVGDYWLTEEQLRFDCLVGLGFSQEHAFILVWGGIDNAT